MKCILYIQDLYLPMQNSSSIFIWRLPWWQRLCCMHNGCMQPSLSCLILMVQHFYTNHTARSNRLYTNMNYGALVGKHDAIFKDVLQFGVVYILRLSSSIGLSYILKLSSSVAFLLLVRGIFLYHLKAYFYGFILRQFSRQWTNP